MIVTRFYILCAAAFLTGALALAHRLWFASGGSHECEILQTAASENTTTERRDGDASEQLAGPSSSQELVG